MSNSEHPQSQAKASTTPAASGCCSSTPTETDHCASSGGGRIDKLMWGSGLIVVSLYLLHLSALSIDSAWLAIAAASVYQLINIMWFSMVIAVIVVGIIGYIPNAFITATLGRGGSWNGIWRATMAGVMLDVCSHGILMVAMQLYRRGASLGQVMAFLIASPWNSISLTIILVALIGLTWTLVFILLSVVIALFSGRLFDLLVQKQHLPANPNPQDDTADFRFWQEAKTQLRRINFSFALLTDVLWQGLKGSRVVLRWLLFGVVLASLIRAFIDLDTYQTLFGPTLVGLSMTLLAATIIEVCSEGSTPIAADIMTRANAPGNSFTFLMAGVSTDYTEIMSLKDTTHSWKIALFLPLVTLPQILVLGWILNSLG